MNFRSYLTFFAILLCCGLGAQTTAERAAERAKNRAERKAQSKVDNKVDKAVDDAFNSIGNLFKKKSKTEPDSSAEKTSTPNEQADNQNAGILGGLMGGGGDWEPYTNPTSFSITMETQEVRQNGNKVDNSEIRLGVTTDRFAIIISDDDAKEVNQMILNTQNGMTTMITTDKKGEKTGYRLRIPRMGETVTETGEEVMDRYTFEKTGERKMIDGYDCEKVIVTDTKEGAVTESWITQDLDITSAEIFGGMATAFGGKAPKPRGGIGMAPYEGFPILSTTTAKGKTYVTRFRDIKVGEENMDRSLLDTSGVEIQSLGF